MNSQLKIMDKIKILVACHKPEKVYEDNVYIPIHVGRSLSRYKNEMNGMIGDDTGENISVKNQYYCELTAHYWAWKNMSCEYIGLCHYRRYFETKFSNENIDSMMEGYDIICSYPIYSKITLGDRLSKYSSLEDFQIFMFTLHKYYPNMYNSALATLKGCKHIPYNMFIMRKENYQNFISWQFDLLEKFEKQIRFSNYSRCKRILGYYAEALVPIYIDYYGLKAKYDRIIPMIGQNATKRIFRDILHKYQCLLYNKLFPQHLDLNISAVLVGLKNDGIDADKVPT